MRLKHTHLLPFCMALLAACSDSGTLLPDNTDRNQTYSFTAILDGAKSRLGYQEDPDSHDLKMVWNEGDVIRLYPDPSMNDPEKYYEFVANTGAGTSHTVFVHQGYILNWEHWKGKAIYAFPDESNVNAGDDNEKFLAKAYVQKANDNTEHLKYAEFKPGTDGKKSYSGYWTAMLEDANLKMDHQMTFEHRHTLVYKIMLGGFLFDIPGGSQLRMSGDAWPEDDVTVLTLGDEDDKEPFLKVEKYSGYVEDNDDNNPKYHDNVLTAYIIRQVRDDGGTDGSIQAGQKLKFELLYYDPQDGEVMMELDPQDSDEHRRTADDPNGSQYFTNVPWGDEYTWEVTVTEPKQYLAGDYVVADLSRMKHKPSQVAIDLGLPVKWAAFNLGADRPDRYGSYFMWGNSTYEHTSYNFIVLASAEPAKNTWDKGDPNYDAAARMWGGGWRMPEYTELRDLIQYTEITDGKGNYATPDDGLWTNPEDGNNNFKRVPTEFIQKRIDEQGKEVHFLEISSKVNDRYIYMPLAGYVTKVSQARREEWGAFLSSTRKQDKRVLTLTFMMNKNIARGYSHAYSTGKDCRVFSLRAVKESAD